MPTAQRVPSYRLHRSDGRAVVTLNGRDVFLGRYGTPESRQRYARVIAEWEAAGRQLMTRAEDLTVLEVVAHLWTWAQSHYRKPEGTPAGELENFRLALRPLKSLYGDVVARDFGPRSLRGLQREMSRLGWCRNYINRQVNRVRAVFKWAAAEELVPASVWHGLQALSPLKKGRTDARESDAVKPVLDAHIDAVLPHVTPPVRAMIQLQRLTGARSTELCAMRGVDIDTGGTVWLYRPAAHKSAHHGHDRTIYLGPRAQAMHGC